MYDSWLGIAHSTVITPPAKNLHYLYSLIKPGVYVELLSTRVKDTHASEEVVCNNEYNPSMFVYSHSIFSSNKMYHKA